MGRASAETREEGRNWRTERNRSGDRRKREEGNAAEGRRRDVDRAQLPETPPQRSSSPLSGRALPDCRREVAEVWPRS